MHKAFMALRSTLNCLERMNTKQGGIFVGVYLTICTVFLLCITKFVFTIAPGATLSDQVNYLTCAKNILSNNSLASNSIYPSFLNQSFNSMYFYMPGHCLSLALSMWLFGEGPWQIMLPGLVGLWIAIFSLFFIGKRFSTPTVGLAAAITFALQAEVLFQSATTMSELTTLASVLLSLAFFSYLPQVPINGPGQRSLHKIWLIPLFLIVPFLFRETNALLVFVFIGIAFSEKSETNIKIADLIKVFLTSVAVLLLIYKLPVLKRPSLMMGFLWEGGVFKPTYLDAFRFQHFSPTISEWFAVLTKTFQNNCIRTFEAANWKNFVHGESSSVYVTIFFLTIFTVIFGALRRNYLYVGIAIYSFVHSLFIYTLYYPNIRFSFIPLSLLSISSIAIFNSIPMKRVKVGSLLVILALIAFPSQLNKVYKMINGFMPMIAEKENCTKWLDELHIDPNGILISPESQCQDYILHKFPMKWSFIPQDMQTFKLLEQRYKIGTVILFEDHPLRSDLEGHLLQKGFSSRNVLDHHQRKCVVFSKG